MTRPARSAGAADTRMREGSGRVAGWREQESVIAAQRRGQEKRGYRDGADLIASVRVLSVMREKVCGRVFYKEAAERQNDSERREGGPWASIIWHASWSSRVLSISSPLDAVHAW